MAIDYNIYSIKTGKCISGDRYAGMPFLLAETQNIGKECTIKWRFTNTTKEIADWTTDKASELWKLLKSDPLFSNENIFNYGTYYYSKSDIYKLSKLMDVNKHVLVELMENNDSDGLIVEIF